MVKMNAFCPTILHTCFLKKIQQRKKKDCGRAHETRAPVYTATRRLITVFGQQSSLQGSVQTNFSFWAKGTVSFATTLVCLACFIPTMIRSYGRFSWTTEGRGWRDWTVLQMANKYKQR